MTDGVVHDYDKDTFPCIYAANEGIPDLLCAGTRKDGPGHGGTQEAVADESCKGWLMAAAATRDQ